MGHRRVHDVLETTAMPAFYLIPQRMRDSNIRSCATVEISEQY